MVDRSRLYRGLVCAYDVAVILIVSGYLLRQFVACHDDATEAKCLTIAEWGLALSFLVVHVVVALLLLFCGRDGKGLATVSERRLGVTCSLLMACALGYVAFFAGLHFVSTLEQNAPRIVRALDGTLPSSSSTCTGGLEMEGDDAEHDEVRQLFAEMNGEAKTGQGCKAGTADESFSLWQIWQISVRTLVAIVKVLLTAPDEPQANNSMSATALRTLREEGMFYKLCSTPFVALAVFGALLQMYIIARLDVDPPMTSRSPATAAPSQSSSAAGRAQPETRGNEQARSDVTSAKKTA